MGYLLVHRCPVGFIGTGRSGLKPRFGPWPRVVERYEVTEPISAFGWFILGTLSGLKDRRAELRESMARSLDRVAEICEGSSPSA